ncbi:site-2 protease family protein [Pseudonocardia sp. S2-4]|uniref:Site-2 protease family protein n=2 Tax=Pseudonocardia humida TaxID=2800819 RepID=A0ABT0ZUI9_9PSEU|nr:site-2 protease family protein [Pseudonocardia humida]
MMTVLGIVIFFVGILLSVAWHELGHFTTAKWFGIKVPEFMVGFGKTIWSRKRGETEFGLKAIPLGGYIRMIGMIPPAPGSDSALGRTRRTGPFQGLMDDARRQSAMDVAPEDADRQFYLRAPWKRVVVMFAGPFMNLVLAVVLFAIVLMGFGVRTYTTTVSEVSACVLPATVAADGPPPQCPADAPPTPAAAAGFQPGDKIVAFNGTPYEQDDWRGMQEAIRSSSGTVTVTVERDGQRLDLTPTLITTQLRDLDDPERIVDASFLGLSPLDEIQRKDLPAVAGEIGSIISRTGEAIIALPSRVPALFGSVFLGEERDLDGPIGVVGVSRIGGEILAQDIPVGQEIAFFLQLLAAVNISLFLFNLLPIPPLDGGQIFPALWEAVKKRIARLRGRPDPGPVDVAKLLPVAYVVALVFIAWSGLLLVADVINPVRLFQ